MKKWITLALSLALMLALVGCVSKSVETSEILELSEISNYTQKRLEEKLIGLSEEEIHNSWGEPDGLLSGFWGDIWHFDKENNRKIILYYDGDGKVEHITINENVSAFSYEEALQVYRGNDPGVKYDGFQNTSESEVKTCQQAIDRAKNECTIEYDTTDVFYDSTTEVWRVDFYTEGTLGGCQSVYLDNKGLTCLIVYGE